MALDQGMADGKGPPKLKRRVAPCPGCGERRVLGRCEYDQDALNMIDHCRECCDEPRALKWKPSLVGSIIQVFKKKGRS